MTVKSFLKNISIGLTLIGISIACTTDDILPVLELNISDTDLSEAGGSLTLSAVLNSAASQQISVPLTFSGTALLSEDYSVSSEQIIIEVGNESGSVTFLGLQDDSNEGTETIAVQISNARDVLLLSETQIEISLLDDDVDTDEDGVPDNVDGCPDVAGAIINNGCPWLGFLINEVLYDPPATDALGDANGDGTRQAQEDEFIELFNSTENSLDLSGYTVSDNLAVRHTFPSGTIMPSNSILVLFGGGTPDGNFGGAIVQTANGLDNLLNLNNSLDSVIIKDQEGAIIISYNSADTGVNHGADQSVTRSPDLSGNFVLHTEANSNGALFSPGTRTDGSSF